MARRERLHLSRYQSIETYRDWNGRLFIACSSGCSMVFRDAKVLRRWLNLPLKTPSREAFDSWIASLEAADAQRKGAKPLTSEAPIEQTSPSLSQELLATGFGPECHEDEDPTANTRVII